MPDIWGKKLTGHGIFQKEVPGYQNDKVVIFLNNKIGLLINIESGKSEKIIANAIICILVVSTNIGPSWPIQIVFSRNPPSLSSSGLFPFLATFARAEFKSVQVK